MVEGSPTPLIAMVVVALESIGHYPENPFQASDSLANGNSHF
jgi:hypothetical protein